MKSFIVFLFAFIAATLFNLRLLHPGVLDRVSSGNFIPLTLGVAVLFCVYAVWIGTQHIWIQANRYDWTINKQTIGWVSKRLWPIYLIRVVLPVLITHILIVWLAVSATDDPVGYLFFHIVTYVPILFLFIGGYSLFLWYHPGYILTTNFFRAREKDNTVEEPDDEQGDLYIYMPFYDIMKQTQIGPVRENRQVRFLDIFAIYGRRGGRFVFLTNGEKVFADKIMQELEDRGLDRWILKISRNYSINMLLVLYTIDTRNKTLKLQPEVYNSLLKNLRPAEIKAICTIGPGMKNTLVEDFLADNETMDYEGWDDFIPLH